MVQLGLIKAGDKTLGFDTPNPPVSGEDGGGLGGGGGGGGGGKVAGGTMSLERSGDAEIGFAIEMKIQIKRAEREKKRKVRMMMNDNDDDEIALSSLSCLFGPKTA